MPLSIYTSIFTVSQVLLVTMACVVHYDLLGLFLTYPYGRYAYTTVGEPQHQHDHQPVVDFNGMWMPKPGTDPNVRYPGPKMDGLMHDLNLDFDLDLGFDDDDDFWSEVTDPDDDANNGGERVDRATCSAGAKAAADDDTAGEDTGTCSAGGGGGGGGGSGYLHPGPSFPTVDLPPTRDDHVDEDQSANDHDNDFDDFDFDDDDDGFVATGEEYDDDVF